MARPQYLAARIRDRRRRRDETLHAARPIERLEIRIVPATIQVISIPTTYHGFANLSPDSRELRYSDTGNTTSGRDVDGFAYELVDIESPVGGSGAVRIAPDSPAELGGMVEVKVEVFASAGVVFGDPTAEGTVSDGLNTKSFSVIAPPVKGNSGHSGSASLSREFEAKVGDRIDFTAMVSIAGLSPPGFYFDPAFHPPVPTIFPPQGGHATIAVLVTVFDPFLVTNTSDSNATNPQLIPGSLRYAIAKANEHPGLDTITFDIPGSGNRADGKQVIVPNSPLPAITDRVIIDASTQPGFTGAPQVVVQGGRFLPGAPAFDGLTITGDGCTVRGLEITLFNGNAVRITGSNNKIQSNLIDLNVMDGVRIEGAGPDVSSGANIVGADGDGLGDGAEFNVIVTNEGTGVAIDGLRVSGNIVAGNFVGDGGPFWPMPGGNRIGVSISGGSANNRIGTDGDGVSDALERNIIAGSKGDGVLITGAFSSNNLVAGNYIGTLADGTTGLGNGANGVEIAGHATDNRIGEKESITPVTPWLGNVISASGLAGVLIAGEGTDIGRQQVIGNRVGTDVNGSAALPNQDGLVISGSSFNKAQRNLISGNRGDGVRVVAFANDNVIESNQIGTDLDGKSALGNFQGVRVGAHTFKTIVQFNLISANGTGVIIEGPSELAAEIFGNFIGTDLDGKSAISNGIGILIDGQPVAPETERDATSNRIQGNLISGNAWNGVQIQGVGARDNLLAGNKIGTDSSGTLPLRNGGSGIVITGGASGTTVGGKVRPEANVIAANGWYGIWLTSASGNAITGNFVGMTIDGLTPLGNALHGVFLSNASAHNTVGGTADGEGNTIAANGWDGLVLADAGTTGNLVAGNRIGTDEAGSLARGNGGEGLLLIAGAANNTVSANVISANGGYGVWLNGTSGNALTGNLIGLGVDGQTALGNARHGVFVSNASAHNTFGGTVPGAGNTIAANGWDGLVLADAGTTGNLLAGNRVGTDVSGALARGNGGVGVHILAGASRNTVGGAAPGARNIISANHGDGVSVHDAGTVANVVTGNVIGLAADGRTALGNGGSGVVVRGSAANNTVGGIGAGNTIAANAGYGIAMNDQGTTGNLVTGNRIGTDATGALARGNGLDGIQLTAPNNTIGGTSAGAGNVISGNRRFGVWMLGGNATGDLVQGNLIGTDAGGTAALGNALDGLILQDAPGNTIGGTAAGARNVVSANGRFGVWLVGANARANVVQGDLVGTDAAGSSDLGNVLDGLILQDAPGNTVGGTADGAGNVVSGNDRFGVWIVGAKATGNVVQGNRIGTTKAGTAALGNGDVGLDIQGAPGNTVGGTADGAGNVIAANAGYGVWVVGTDATGNLLQGNTIGTDAAGSTALGNKSDGVRVQDGGSTTIGGTAAGAGNLISGNVGHGIAMTGAAGNNVVQGNRIGTNRSGAGAIGNGGDGVDSETADNTIGSSAPGAGNLISDNAGNGVHLANSGATRDRVQGNRIGTDASGNSALANGSNGVLIDQAAGNTVGGAGAGEGNLISGNAGDGVQVNGGSATGNLIAGDRIGTDASGLRAIGNAAGVSLVSAPSNTVGGTSAGARNILSGNRGAGISVGVSTDVLIQGNYVGLGADGLTKVGNAGYGISVTVGSDRATIGGTAAGAGNVVSGNARHGVQFLVSSFGVVQGNFIGTDASGLRPVGNTGAGPVSGIGLSIENSSSLLVGGTTPAARNVIAGNVIGVAITGTVPVAQFNLVEGNFIGVGADDSTRIANSSLGIGITSPNNTVGGSSVGAGNVISGNGSHGVSILGSGATGNVVAGNRIGTDASGTFALANGGRGVIIRQGASSNLVGLPGAGNTIAFNSGAGIAVVDTASTSNEIRFNSLRSNGGLAIDLGGDGPTANDPGDTDAGPNGLQNAPTIVSATPGASTRIVGSFSGAAGVTLTLDFYASQAVDAGNRSRGERWLGSTVIQTDGSGAASFDVTLAATTALGEQVTATATGAGGTSEFSASVPIATPDTTPPSSKVNPLAQRQTSLSFAVSASGTDPGASPSGIASYDLYVSDNGGPFTRWATVTAAAPSRSFAGQSNHSYAFASLATDAAGNVEVKTLKIEASTYVPDLSPPDTAVLATSTVNAAGTFTLRVSGHDVGGGTLSTFKVFVQVDNTPAQQVGGAIPAGSPDAGGNHIVTATYQGLTDGLSHGYRFYSVGTDTAGNVEPDPASPADVVFSNQVFSPPQSLQVTAFDVQHGGAGRSYVRYVDLSFNQAGPLQSIVNSIVNDPTNATPATHRIRLFKYDLNGTPASKVELSIQKTLSVIDHAIEFDFGAAGIGGNASVTAGDGYYEVLVDLGSGATEAHHFYRLLGDVNGDRGVDDNDIALIAADIGNSGLFGTDVDGSGSVTSQDKTLATRSKGRKLASALQLG